VTQGFLIHLGQNGIQVTKAQNPLYDKFQYNTMTIGWGSDDGNDKNYNIFSSTRKMSFVDSDV
jgi:hypothetical protein